MKSFLPAILRSAPLCVMAAVSPAMWGQAPSGLTARELFYAPPPTAAASTQSSVASSTPKTTTKKRVVAKKTTAPANATQTASSQDATGGATQAASSTSSAGESGSASNAELADSRSSVPVVKVSNAPLGIRYTVMKESGAGHYQGVDPATTFRSGDRIRIQVESNQNGYLYVVTQGSSGGWQLLFPSAEVANGDNEIARGQTRMIPPRNQFKFDQQEGTEKIFLVLSRQPEPDLDKLIYSIRGGSTPAAGKPAPERMLMAKATINDELVSRLRSQVIARDLVFETVSDDPKDGGNAPSSDTATYVVNKSGSADARLVVDLKLNHK